MPNAAHAAIPSRSRQDQLVAVTASLVVHPSRRHPRAQQAVLGTALNLLRRDGYAAISIEAIAAVSGVAKTSIYRWWPNKAAIFLDLYRNLLPDSHFDRPDSAPDDALVAVLTETLSAYRETGLGAALPGIISDSHADPVLYKHLAEDFVAARRGRLTDLIAAGRSAGCWHDRVDPGIAADQIIGAIWHCLFIDPTRLDDAYAHALVNQLRKPTP